MLFEFSINLKGCKIKISFKSVELTIVAGFTNIPNMIITQHRLQPIAMDNKKVAWNFLHHDFIIGFNDIYSISQKR